MARLRSGMVALVGGLSLMAPVARAEGQTWAVVVGIDNYSKEGIPDLHYAGADAKIFAQALQTLLKVPKDHLFLFTSDTPEASQSPNRLNLVFRLDWLSKNTKAEDVVIFYFAGHGAQVDGTSFLMTNDADPRSLETLKASALSTADLNRLIDRTAAAKTLTVLDACRNNPGGGRDEYRVAQQFALTASGKEVVGLVSCSPGQRSWEWEEKKHGFFTYFLVEAMQGKSGGIQGNITPSSLAEYLKVQVPTQTLTVVRQPQNPRLFYDGPSSSGWVLGKAPASATPVKELEAQAAKADLLMAEKTELEARLRAEEARRREVEVRLEAVERKSSAVGITPSADVQKLALARDLALKELLETQKQLETLRVQLAARGGPGAETELMLAEREQLRAENKVLQAKVSVLEGRLQQGGISMARSFTLEENGPLAARVGELDKVARSNPSEENRYLAVRAQVDKSLDESTQLRKEMNRLTSLLFDVVREAELRFLAEVQAGKEKDDLILRLAETGQQNEAELATLKMQLALAENRMDQAALARRLALTQLTSLDEGSSRSLEVRRAAEEKALRESQAQNRRLVASLQNMLKFEPSRRRFISRRFTEINSMPGLGDILDIPVQVGPELQSLP